MRAARSSACSHATRAKSEPRGPPAAGGPAPFPTRPWRRETVLTPALIHHHRHRIRQIDAAVGRPHRNADACIGRKLRQHLGGKAAALRSEHQGISGLIFHPVMAAAAARAEGVHAAPLEHRPAMRPVGMHGDAGQVVIIQPRARELLVGKIEAERCNQMEIRAGVGGQADDVPGIGRDFGLVEDDFEHRQQGTGRFSKGRGCAPPRDCRPSLRPDA